MNHPRRILYIGKATAGPFDGETPAEDSFNGRGPFWAFARSVSKLADPACTDLSNVAWSNIFKQGVIKGNPSGNIAESQRDAATQALRGEIKKFTPSLVLLVNAGYYEEVPKMAFDIKDGESGPGALIRTPVKGENKIDLWSRPQYDVFPPIVWMYHPQWKSKAYLDTARNLIRATTHWA